MKQILLALALAAVPAQDEAARIRELIGKLGSDRVEERDAAARELKDLGPKALPELEKASGDRDLERSGRARHLSRWIELHRSLAPRLRETFPGLEDRLASDDDHAWTEAFLRCFEQTPEGTDRTPGPWKRELAPLALRALRGARTSPERQQVAWMASQYRYLFMVPALIPCLKDPDAATRRMISHAIASLDGFEAIPDLLACVPQPGDVGLHARRALIDLGAREATKEILRGLDYPWRQEQGDGALALARLGIGEAAPEIEKLLGANEAYTRERAARALGELGAKGAVPDLRKLLKGDREQDVRAAAAEALGILGAGEAIPDLKERLSDESHFVRATAIRALGQLRVADVVPSMLAFALDTGRGDWLHDTLLAIVQTGSREAAPALLKWALEDGRKAPAACEALVFMEAPGRVEELRSHLKSDSWRVREAALAMLGGLRAREAGPAILPLLNDEFTEVRAAAALAAGELGLPEAVPALRKLLDAERPPEAAVVAIGLLGAKEAIPALRTLVKGEDRSLRIAAVEALGRLGCVDAVAEIMALRCEPVSVRALGRLGGPAAEAALVEALEDDLDETRVVAAVELCRRGRLEGARPLLADRRGLGALNALRSPEAWTRLAAKAHPGDLKGTRREVAERLARELGLAWDDASVTTGTYATWKATPCTSWKTVSSALALDALLDLLDGPFSFVVEEGRLRVLSQMQALEFWRAWWLQRRR